MTLKNLESAAMKLPVKERGKLAAALISSLDTENPEEVERMWAKEADRRYRAYREGRTTATSAKEAIANARRALRS